MFEEHKHFDKGLSPELNIDIMKTLNSPEYFFKKLINHIDRNLNESSSLTQRDVIFISSPQNIAKIFANTSSKNLGVIQGHKIFTSLDTLNFFKKEAQNCKIFRNYFGDILSTLEKEIMVLSKSYYRARPSNWSFNVQGHRFSLYSAEDLRHDRCVLDVFLDRD